MSNVPLTTRRQLELLRDLQRAANDRHDAQASLDAQLKSGLAEAQTTFEKRQQQIDNEWERARVAAEEEFDRQQKAAEQAYEQQRAQTQQEYQGLRSGVESQHTEITRQALSQQQETAWETWAVFEASKDAPRQRLQQAVARLKQSGAEVAVLERDAQAIMQMRRFGAPPADESLGSTNGSSASFNADAAVEDRAEAAAARVEQFTQAARQAALVLRDQPLARLFEGWYPLGLIVLLWIVGCVACGMAWGWQGWMWLALGSVVTIVLSAALLVGLYPIARRRALQKYGEVQQALAAAREALQVAAAEAKAQARDEAQALLAGRDAVLSEANHKFHSVVGEKDEWKRQELSGANALYPQQLAELRDRHQHRLTEIENAYRSQLGEASAERDRRHAANQQQYDERTRLLRAEFDAAWQQMAEHWHARLASLHAVAVDMRGQCERLFPDWDHTQYAEWTPPAEPAAAIQFGRVTLDLARVKNGLPGDARLTPADRTLQLPALMSLEEHPVLVATTSGAGREPAVDLLGLLMLRMLTAMPPGKIRLTVIDPVGLGENFASFMHLADYDERLIASRIWTESKHINEQLTRLTTHMETVLQKYLRNEFATIHEYNEHAGEVAEPFQVLVVANFPANFNEETARRLVSIATSGPRCGVFTLVSLDRDHRLPSDFRLEDLLESALHLDWQADDQEFVWRYPAFEKLELTVDNPPRADRFVDVVREAGAAAKASIRVEVPFEVVAPDENERWTHDSSKELAVPIGRAGATRLQELRLGKGTSQHVLICGKTGSGKSTLLHALITNAALHFSPDELEFYLVDFKKGVEFKCYAAGRLPHARVIAVESEREFGLSVLERLDEELRRRGDLFRTLGVQDLAGFRAARPDEPMPRVLLVIDEFQELFVEDDKLAQDANLLLDRLIRQGRAFGMHVILGSQTLSGAYSLARSTMGQMAVRIALQCSEADAHLILSDERNTAARYLSRPGEAIYNDQNGLLTGNSPFQVVWLSENQRLGYLEQIERRQQASDRVWPPQIVFEGNAPADPERNIQLGDMLQAPPATPPAEQKAWLGAAVAIKEPTCATFARHAGSNMLVVGHREESAVGVLSTAVISLAAQNARPAERPARPAREQPPTFVILDGTRPESPEYGTWPRVAEAIGNSAQVVDVAGASAAINELADEVARREEAGEESGRPVYLVIHNGGRFRDLRRRDDDFSFSASSDKPASADKRLSEILRNGPAWGIHTLVWCDSHNNAMRMFDRLALREFEMRVVFQMSAADSSSLLDSPAASKLRVHRGLFYSDELGTAEKFRPYGSPTDEWLDVVRQSLQL